MGFSIHLRFVGVVSACDSHLRVSIMIAGIARCTCDSSAQACYGFGLLSPSPWNLSPRLIATGEQ